LLKTLEEPPAHVIFVLATTELDRVPDTIVSRCQTFSFKKPSHSTLKTLALDVAKKEGASLTPAGAELIALMGDGSFRDTLGILQKVLTVSADEKLTEEEVGRVVGAPKGALVNLFVKSLAEKNIAAAIEVFHQGVLGGAEPKVFTLLAITKVRAVLLLRFAPKLKDELAGQFGPDDTALLQAFAKESLALNAALLAELLTALIDMNRAPLSQIPMELALYRALG
jgi:DNA polymerase-3 subunit gamma/tau